MAPDQTLNSWGQYPYSIMDSSSGSQETVESRCKRVCIRKDQEGEGAKNLDRISELPDCVLSRILSFLGTWRAMRTSVLSRRWRHLWTSIDVLNFYDQLVGGDSFPDSWTMYSFVPHPKTFDHLFYYVLLCSKALSLGWNEDWPDFPHLTHLAMSAFAITGWALLPALLHRSPNLHILHLIKDNDDEHRFRNRDWKVPERVPLCLQHSLEVVRFDYVTGRRDELHILEYMLDYADCLRRMAVVVEPNGLNNERWSQLKKLQDSRFYHNFKIYVGIGEGGEKGLVKCTLLEIHDEESVGNDSLSEASEESEEERRGSSFKPFASNLKAPETEPSIWGTDSTSENTQQTNSPPPEAISKDSFVEEEKVDDADTPNLHSNGAVVCQHAADVTLEQPQTPILDGQVETSKPKDSGICNLPLPEPLTASPVRELTLEVPTPEIPGFDEVKAMLLQAKETLHHPLASKHKNTDDIWSKIKEMLEEMRKTPTSFPRYSQLIPMLHTLQASAPKGTKEVVTSLRATVERTRDIAENLLSKTESIKTRTNPSFISCIHDYSDTISGKSLEILNLRSDREKIHDRILDLRQQLAELESDLSHVDGKLITLQNGLSSLQNEGEAKLPNIEEAVSDHSSFQVTKAQLETELEAQTRAILGYIQLLES